MFMWTLLMWQVAAQAAPAAAAAPTSAWACSRATLESGALCVFDGTSASQRPSREASEETTRAARALLRSLCAEVAQIGGTPEPSVLSSCSSADKALGRVCDHGGVRLLDDEGRFNPGHARCYTALRAAVERAEELREDATAASRTALDAPKPMRLP